MSETILTTIDRFLRDSGMSASYFGKKAVNNSEVVDRLRKGRTITLVTQESILEFIGAERQRRELPDKGPDGPEEEHEPAAPPGRALTASAPAP